MNEISTMPSALTQWLSEREDLENIRFLTEFPPVKKAVPLRKVTVAVGFEKIIVSDNFEASDEENILGENEYCREAEITLRFSIHAPYSMGGEACHEAFADIVDCLTFDSGLDIVTSGCGKITEDRDTDAFVLNATAAVKANLCPAAQTSLEFPSFLDKTLLCGSHIRNTDIHLSPEQQTRLNEPYISGTYLGTGAGERHFDLGFAPAAVIVCAEGMPPAVTDEGTDKVMCALGIRGSGTMGIETVDDGFKVTNGESFTLAGAFSSLNEAGTVYTYVALR